MLTGSEVFAGRVCKAMERHKCRPSTGCTNCEFLGGLALFVLFFSFYQKCWTYLKYAHKVVHNEVSLNDWRKSGSHMHGMGPIYTYHPFMK